MGTVEVTPIRFDVRQQLREVIVPIDGGNQTLTSSGTSAASTALPAGTTAAIISTDTSIHLRGGPSPQVAEQTDHYLEAGSNVTIAVNAGDLVAVIDDV